MHHDRTNRARALGAFAFALAAIASVVLAACGGSSGATTSTQARALAPAATTATTNAATTPAPSTSSSATTTPVPAPAKTTTTPSTTTTSAQASYRECLAHNGVTLPPTSTGSSQPPSGVSRATYEAAVRKCRGLPSNAAPTTTPTRTPKATVKRSQSFKQAIDRFVVCMRKHGQNLPEPNTSGSGPIFKPSTGVNTSSPAFVAATRACLTTLGSALPGA